MNIIRSKTRNKDKVFKQKKAAIFKLNFILPVTILAIMVFMAIFAPLIAPYSPVVPVLTERLLPPFFSEGGSTAHILGTDAFGRDILTRIIYGSRISISVSVIVILINSTIGTILGIIGGYIGGRVDSFLMRLTDVVLAIPVLLIALLLAVIIGPSYGTVIFSLTMLGWAWYARLIRGETLKIRHEDFVTQARIIGNSDLRIMRVHIFPNIINSLIVIATLQIGLIILVEAMLSFLGAGIPPPTASWGNMISDGRNLIDRAWWISFFPGIAIGLVVLSGNFLGDWLRDKLDPKLRQL